MRTRKHTEELSERLASFRPTLSVKNDRFCYVSASMIETNHWCQELTRRRLGHCLAFKTRSCLAYMAAWMNMLTWLTWCNHVIWKPHDEIDTTLVMEHATLKFISQCSQRCRWRYLTPPGKSCSSSVCSRNVHRLCVLSLGGTTVPCLHMADLQK